MDHEVLVRSQLTKGKYKFEYFNRERTPIYDFSQERLMKFDIIFIDANSYNNLSSKSFSELINTVKGHGLGIIVQPDIGFSNCLEGNHISISAQQKFRKFS